MAKTIDPNESVAIIESQGMMAAARLAQLISLETRARVVAVAPVTGSGSVTTIIAGPLAEVQHALEAARERKAMIDSAFFARPNLETMEMLIGSAVGEPVKLPKVHPRRKEEASLSLFLEQQSVGAKSKKAKQKDTSAAKLHVMNPVPKRAPKRKRRTEPEAYVRRSFMDTERMPVHALRRYARSIPGFPIAGREISRANRNELLQLIKSHFEHLDTRAAHAVPPQTMMPS
jgi:microcompartment protein CcmL/EutN